MIELTDLEEALEQCADDMRALRGAHIFLTGGTGFVGIWLLAVLLHSINKLHLKSRVTILTRDADRFKSLAPGLTRDEHVSFVHGDVRSLPGSLPLFDAVIHAAAPTDAKYRRDRPADLLDIAFEGTRQVLRVASRSGDIPLLFISSGAVYGRQPVATTHMLEDTHAGPDPTSVANAYHEGKRVAEMLCALENAASGLKAKIARLYSFVGPFLPFNSHYAVGNFVRDAVAGAPIRISGDGSNVRSYLYGADMSVWLWKILIRGQVMRPYNVGSSQALTLRELALLVQREVNPDSVVEIAGRAVREGEIDIYVPDITRVTSEIGVQQCVSLTDAIRRFARFVRARLHTLESCHFGSVTR